MSPVPALIGGSDTEVHIRPDPEDGRSLAERAAMIPPRLQVLVGMGPAPGTECPGFARYLAACRDGPVGERDGDVDLALEIALGRARPGLAAERYPGAAPVAAQQDIALGLGLHQGIAAAGLGIGVVLVGADEERCLLFDHARAGRTLGAAAGLAHRAIDLGIGGEGLQFVRAADRPLDMPGMVHPRHSQRGFTLRRGAPVAGVGRAARLGEHHIDIVVAAQPLLVDFIGFVFGPVDGVRALAGGTDGTRRGLRHARRAPRPRLADDHVGRAGGDDAAMCGHVADARGHLSAHVHGGAALDDHVGRPDAGAFVGDPRLRHEGRDHRRLAGDHRAADMRYRRRARRDHRAGMHVGYAGGGGQGAGLRRGCPQESLAAAPRLVMRNRAGRAFAPPPEAIPFSGHDRGAPAMPLIWLSALCAAIMVLLLVLGERTLPLLGDDRELAARLYKTVFMLLGTGIVVGLVPVGARWLAGFFRARAAGSAGQDGVFGAWAQFVTRHDIPGLMERAGPVLAGLVGIGGIVLAVVIW